MTKAVIFDMDGTLVSSETWWIQSLARLITSHGGSVPADIIQRLGGCSSEEETDFVAQQLGMDWEEAEALRTAWHEAHPIDYGPLLKPGAREFIQRVRGRGCRTAVASSSPLKAIEQMVRQCHLEGLFDVLVSGDQFVRTKPDPEIYNYTVKRLDTAPEDVLVIEDSPRGIQAAKAARLACIGLHDPETDFDTSLADCTIEDFASLCAVTDL